jgi:hypothetical protein
VGVTALNTISSATAWSPNMRARPLQGRERALGDAAPALAASGMGVPPSDGQEVLFAMSDIKPSRENSSPFPVRTRLIPMEG